MRIRLLAIAFLLSGFCAPLVGVGPFTEDQLDDAPTDCDLASLFLDAKKRLPEEIKQDIGTIKSDEYEYRLMAFFSDNKIMIYYEPALLNEDPDLLIVSAGRTSALYDDNTCDFLEIKSQR